MLLNVNQPALKVVEYTFWINLRYILDSIVGDHISEYVADSSSIDFVLDI
jgi:hypothetical protein